MNDRPSRGRHAHVPEWVFLHPTMQRPLTTLHVYTAMCILANYVERISDGDWEKLAEYTALGRTVIYGALKAMRDDGIIVLQKGGTYWLPLDEPYVTADIESVTADEKSVTADCSSYTENYSEESEQAPPTPTAEKVKVFEPIVSELCTLLASRISERNEGNRPKITTKWKTDMDRLLRRGDPAWAEPKPVDPERIERVINGIFDLLAEPKPGSTFCWANNIRSPGSLREKWDQVRLDLNALPGVANTAEPSASDTVQPTLDPDLCAVAYDEADSTAQWTHPETGQVFVSAIDHPMYYFTREGVETDLGRKLRGSGA